MKKNVLFIIPSLGAGGGEKSLINLLSEMDFNAYNVDLFLLNNQGLFMNLIPKEVNVLNLNTNITIFNEGIVSSILKFILKGNIGLAYSRLMFCITNRKNPIGKGEQYAWKYLRKAIGILEKKYDVAIGYLEKTSNYICCDCVEADKKIGWIHNDYRKLDLDKNFDKKYFRKLDYLITVSETCQEILKDEFPKEKEKIRLIHNIISKSTIEKLAQEDIEKNEMSNDTLNILSIGRLHEQKGFDMAIEACKFLRNKGYKICWYVIGEGSERLNLELLIKKNDLQDNFKLLGLKKNPYKYLKACDIYVQPSRYEGKSVAIEEAKLLAKPIIVTNFSTVKNQIEDHVTGLIADMNPESITDKIINLMDITLRLKLKCNLEKKNDSNFDEIKKLYQVIQYD